MRHTTICNIRFADSKPIFTGYITITEFSAETKKSTKANCGQWRSNITTAPGNTRRTQKVFPTINNLFIKKKAQEAKFSNGFRWVRYRWAHKYGYFVKRPSKHRFMQNSITGSTHKFKWRTSTWVPTYCCQWIIRSTYCNCRELQLNAFRWYYIQRKIYSLDKHYKSYDRSFNPTTQQYNTRYASENPKVSFLFNAIEKWRSEILKCLHILSPLEAILQPAKRTSFW